MALITSALTPLDSVPPDTSPLTSPEPSFLPAATPGVRHVPAVRLVATADIAMIMSAMLLSFARSSGSQWWHSGLTDLLSARIHVYDTALLVGFAGAIALLFERAGLYDATRLRRWPSEAGRLLLATTALVALAVLVITATHEGVVDAAAIAWFWLGGVTAVAAARFIRARLSQSTSRPSVRVLVVGSGPHARRICRNLSADPLTRYRVLGFVDTNDEPHSSYVARRMLGRLDALESLLAGEHVDEVHIGLPVKSHYQQIQETIRVCERIGVKVRYGADIFGTELARTRVDRGTGTTPWVELQLVADGWPLAAKRLLDLAGATLALILLSPVMLAAAAAIALASDGPVIHAQERYGLNRRRFRMFKFRTMVKDAERLQAGLEAYNEAPGPVFKIANDPRVTRVGRWLRRTSIDELPQLVNVLAGDMSLVGPRPLPVRDVRRIARSADMRRFSVRPGLTGLWQVSGRSALAFDQWVVLDLHYIDHWSLKLDAAILARTIPAVIRGVGAT